MTQSYPGPLHSRHTFFGVSRPLDRTRLAAMVNLTRIYTRTGDAGSTRLGDMSETTKNDLRLHAYADVDEANATIGLALAQGRLEDDVVQVLGVDRLRRNCGQLRRLEISEEAIAACRAGRDVGQRLPVD
mgnify:CR=1 FL=1